MGPHVDISPGTVQRIWVKNDPNHIIKTFELKLQNRAGGVGNSIIRGGVVSLLHQKLDPCHHRDTKRNEISRRRRSRRAASAEAEATPIFVIQEHDASTHHFDFRLEIDGALKSFAVPKGPSTDPREKRLAVPTEDHPLAYADFEGIIPEGEYGAGRVIVWDEGTYENITEKDGRIVPAGKAMDDGHLHVRLHGKKISGGYALQRISRGENDRWLLIKMDDADADTRRNPISTEPLSVLSGRRIRDIKDDASEGE